MFFHAVYFYPRENAAPTDAAELLEGLKTLKSIPGVTFFETGTPAGTPREVVDNSYLAALLVAYATVEDHDIYQDHPTHLAFIERCKHLWSKVVVFDSLSA